jgi:hypothetical protein
MLERVQSHCTHKEQAHHYGARAITHHTSNHQIIKPSPEQAPETMATTTRQGKAGDTEGWSGAV